MAKYGEMFRESPISDFAALLDRYLQLVTPRKAQRTRKDETAYIATLRAVFGKMMPRAIMPAHVYRLRDKLAAKSGPERELPRQRDSSK